MYSFFQIKKTDLARQNNEESIWSSAAASAVVSTCSVQPLDVIKTTLQKHSLQKQQLTSNYRGVRQLRAII